MQEKTCTRCGDKKPMTPDYFHIDKQKVDGFRSVCVECRKKTDVVKNHKKAVEFFDTCDKEIRKIVKNPAKQSGSLIPHKTMLLETFMHAFGGLDGYVDDCMRNYRDCPEGSAMRQRHLEFVGKLLMSVSDDGGADRDTKDMTDDDLKRAFFELAGHLDGRLKKLEEPKEDDPQ